MASTSVPKKFANKAERNAFIVEHPNLFTTGKTVRRKCAWSNKPHYRVVWSDEEGATTTKDFPSTREIAERFGLCHNTLRHVVSDTATGRRVKSDRYRRLKITKIAKTGGLTNKERQARQRENSVCQSDNSSNED